MVSYVEQCAYEGCGEAAKVIAIGRPEYPLPGGFGTPDTERRGHKLGKYCEEHSIRVVEEGSPEYEVECPCCGCNFGVN